MGFHGGKQRGLRSLPKFCQDLGLVGPFSRRRGSCGRRPLSEGPNLSGVFTHIPVRTMWSLPTSPEASQMRRGYEGFWHHLVPSHHQKGYEHKQTKHLSLIKNTPKTTCVGPSLTHSPPLHHPTGWVIIAIPVAPFGSSHSSWWEATP